VCGKLETQATVSQDSHLRTVEQLAKELIRDPQYRDIFVLYKCMSPFKKCTADVMCNAPNGIAFFCSKCANEYSANQEIREAVEHGAHLLDNNLRSLKLQRYTDILLAANTSVKRQYIALLLRRVILYRYIRNTQKRLMPGDIDEH
jgi:hypothetical protein